MYKYLVLWRDSYSLDRPDQRSVSDFMECEPNETINSFRTELIGIASGNFDPKVLQSLLGADRPHRHNGSWQEWAKMMLLWMSSRH